MATQEFVLQPLTQVQIREIVRLKNAYVEDIDILAKRRDFTLLDREEASHLFEEAAEIVVRIRCHLEQHCGGAGKLRSLLGQAAEYLWKLEQLPPEEIFVSGLVHSTLQLAPKTYVCGLSEETIDNWLKLIIDYRNTHQNDKLSVEGSVLEDELLRQWNEADMLLKVTVAKDSTKYWNSSLVSDVQQLVKQVTGFKRRLELVQKKREFNKRRRTISSRSTDETGTSMEIDQAEQTKKQASQPEAAPQSQHTQPQSQTQDQAKAQPQNNPPVDNSKNDEEGVIKIKKLSAEVDQISSQLKTLSQEATDLQTLTKTKPAEALEHIEHIKRRCATYATALMNDLLKLDELAGLEEARLLKKQEINNIQHLLDDVDKLKNGLGKLEVELKPWADKQKEEDIFKEADKELKRQLEEEKTKAAEIPIQAHPQEPQPAQKPDTNQHPDDKLVRPTKEHEKKMDLKEAWNRLRLDPRIEIDEESSLFVLHMTLPGMKKEDIGIEVSEDDGTITIGGIRLPTPNEEQQMRNIVKLRHSPKTEAEENMWILKYSVGRFGRFSRTYRIPKGIDVSDIKGNFNDGILTLTIPKGGPRQIPVRTTHNQTPSAYQDPIFPYTRHVPFYGDPNVWW